MGFRVIETNRGWSKELLHKLSRANGSVAMGFPTGTSSDVLHKAYVNEFGSEGGSSDLKQDVPARPFMAHSVPRIIFESREIAPQFGIEDVPVMLETIGSAGAEAIRDTIGFGDFQGNADYTLKHKRGDHPLIDTGTMQEAVSFKVEGE